MPTRHITAALIGVSAALAVPFAGALSAFGWSGLGQTRPLVQLVWVAPVAQAFMIIAGLSLAILLLARYRVLGGAWTFWAGMLLAVNVVFGLFYLLSWPGLLGERGVIARLPNTALWFAYLASLTVALQVAAVNARRPERLTPRAMVAGYAAAVVAAVLLGLLMVKFEAALPNLFENEIFHPSAFALAMILSAVTAAGAACAWRRGRAEDNDVLEYLALFLLIYAYGLFYSVMGRKRYDVWWYSGRVEVVLSYLVLLFGLLQEGYRLFSGERARAEERAQLLRQLDARTEELSRSNAELGVYAHTVSHDLIAPVNKISMYAELLAERAARKLDDKELDYLARMQKTAVGMAKMLRDILAMSRVDREVYRVEAVNWKRVLDGVLSDLELLIAQAGAVITVGELPKLRAPEPLFRQLFLNLIANAVKFRQKERIARIEVGSRPAEGGVEIFVRDNGIGFSPEQAEEIFKPFVRLNPVEEYEGSGIGLATCRRIADRLRGRLTAAGIPGKGAVFTLWLPKSFLE